MLVSANEKVETEKRSDKAKIGNSINLSDLICYPIYLLDGTEFL